MTRQQLQEKHKLGGKIVLLDDISNHMRRTKPFLSQRGPTDEVNGLRQLGRNEGWDMAVEYLQTIWENSEQQEKRKAVANYSEPQHHGGSQIPQQPATK